MGKLGIRSYTGNPSTCVPEAGESPTSSRSAYTTNLGYRLNSRQDTVSEQNTDTKDVSAGIK